MMAHALAYAGRGWRVLPCHAVDAAGNCSCGDNPGRVDARDVCTAQGKHPANERGATTATTDAEQIERWWLAAPLANIGIATGARLGMWVLDVDGDVGAASLAALQEQHGPLPETMAARTGGGGTHYYWAIPADVTIRNSVRKLADGIDVRGDGGYVLAPPSVHLSGREYTWLNRLPPVEAPAWLVELVTAKPAPPPQNGQATHHPPPALPAGDVARRARDYLATMPPAISGQGGHDQTFDAARKLIHGFGLTPEQALPLLHEYNRRCVPPWNDAELRHKLESAHGCEDQQGRPRGYLLLGNGTPPAPQSGPVAASSGPHSIAWPALAARPITRDWLIPHVLAARQPAVLGGPIKTLKTSTLVDMAVALATGTPWLNHFRTTRAVRVGMVSAESGDEDVRDVARRIAAARRLTPTENLHFIFGAPCLTDMRHLDMLARWCLALRLDVLMLDPLYLMLDARTAGNAGNLYAMGAALRTVRDMADSVRVTPLIAHHTGHGATMTAARNGYEPLGLEHLAQAGIREFARQWLVLSRREQYVPGSGDHALWLTIGGAAGQSGAHALDVAEGALTDPGGRRWTVAVRSPEDARAKAAAVRAEARDERENVAADETREMVRAYLGLHPDGDSCRAIKRACNNRRNVGTVLGEMLRCGELVTTQLNKRGRSEEALKLLQTTSWPRRQRRQRCRQRNKRCHRAALVAARTPI